MMASRAASRLRNAKANQVGIGSKLRQRRCLMASGMLMASAIAPPTPSRCYGAITDGPTQSAGPHRDD